MSRLVVSALLASSLLACGGRGLPRFAREVPPSETSDAGDAGTRRDGGDVIIVRDGGSTGPIRDAGQTIPSCGDGLCDVARGEDFVNCPADCRFDPNRCTPGQEGCACNSTFMFGDPLARDDCNAGLVCAPWDVLSGREFEVTRPVQSCVRPCGSDGDCGAGRRCTSAYDSVLGEHGVTRICVDRLAQDDFFCGAERERRPAVPGVEVQTPNEMVGCRVGATCTMDLGTDLQPGEGVCLQLCGPGRPACSGSLPYCNPVLADGVGVCSVGRLGPGSWCAANTNGRAGLTTFCDQALNAQVFCVGLGVDEGLCMEICNAQEPCTITSATNPYYCEEGLLQNGDGICMSSNCNNFPDTCGEAGPLGTGRVCLDLTETAGLCVDRRTPILAPSGLDTMQNVSRMGDDCQADQLGFAQCPDGTVCVPSGQGRGFCLAGCAVGDSAYCAGLLMNLGLPAADAQCVDILQMGMVGGLCVGD